VAAYLVAAGFPAAVLSTLPFADAVRWIQNNITFSIFMLTAFPVSVGVFAARTHLPRWDALPRWLRYILWGTLAVLVVLGCAGALDDLRDAIEHRVIEPYNFTDYREALALESALREDVGQELVGPLDARWFYQAAGTTFSGGRDWLDRGSAAAHWALVVNAMAGVFVAVFIWYSAALACCRYLGRAHLPPATLDGVLLVYGLLATWFPMRLYSEWYINFQSLAHLARYSAFTLLVLLAVAVGAIIAVVHTSGTVPKVFAAASAGAGMIIGVIGKIEPRYLQPIAEFVEGLSPVTFLTIHVIALIVSVILALPWLTERPPASIQLREPAEPKKPPDGPASH